MLLASPAMIRDQLDEIYRGGDEVVSRLLEGMGGDLEVKELSDEEDEGAASAEQASQRPIIRLVDMMLADGVASRASDIHVEPIEGGVAVRYRIDGVLRQVMKMPRNAGLPLISRIKIMSGLDIADRLRPQDGRARVSVERRAGRPPRLHPPGLAGREGGDPDPEPAGHGPRPRRARHARGRAGGDPAPAQQQGRDRPGHRAHRLGQDHDALLRDPPDPERGRQHRDGGRPGRVPAGARTSSRSRCTRRRGSPSPPRCARSCGRTPTSCWSARSATRRRRRSRCRRRSPATWCSPRCTPTMRPTRSPVWWTWAWRPYKIASALRGVVAQRLMRRLCPACRAASDRAGAGAASPGSSPPGATLFSAVGCPECAMTGYRGRFSIVEVLTMNPELERRIGQGATADQIAEAARAQRHALALGQRSPARPRRASPPWRSCCG